MSRGFVKEYDDQRLDDVRPNVTALEKFLSAENGMRIYEKQSYTDTSTGKQVHEMSDGMKYALDEDNRWYILL